ncbi:hypothetical protein TrRE_jg8193 [Triparma retinervis]|uniref:Uncharacterized protein n=1 Tax=Triparma retinervis TaxID=2557542 RepID=A0A9W7A8X8_9STRA|nr:hypothetical protein TrRE_jg8193 [Triparma retinervis]
MDDVQETLLTLNSAFETLVDTSVLAIEAVPKITANLLKRPTFATIHMIVLSLTEGNPARTLLTDEEQKRERTFKKQDKLRLIRQLPVKVEEGVASVLREGEVKIYQRAVRVRGTVTKMQAIMRGRRERKAMMVEAAKTPVLSTATTPATGSRPRTEGQESSSGGEEHMVMATLRGPRMVMAKNADATLEMAPMEESVDFEDSMESVMGGSVNLHIASSIAAVSDPIIVTSTPVASTPVASTPSTPVASTPVASTTVAKPYRTPPKPIIPISPDTPEEESPSPLPLARRRNSTKTIEVATPAASLPPVVATPKTQEEMDFEMLEAHRVLEGEMEKLKGAMEKERERQREKMRERMREKQRESKDEDASAGHKEVGPVVFYPTHQVTSEPKPHTDLKDRKDERQPRATRENFKVKPSQSAKKEEQREKKPPVPSFTKPPHAIVPTKEHKRKDSAKMKEPLVLDKTQSNSSGASTTITTTTTNDPEIKKVKRDMINAKIKYTQGLKKVLAKEQNLSKKEGELKKKEERVTKLADNLRRQRVTLKKEILKAKKPSELVKQIAELTPMKAASVKMSKTSPVTKSSPKLSPNRFNGSNVMKAPRLSMTERGAAKMGKLMSVYAGTGGSDVGDDYQSRDCVLKQPLGPSNPTVSHKEDDEDMKAYLDKFLPGKAFNDNMGLMGLMEEPLPSRSHLGGPPTKSSQPPSVPSPSPKFSAYKAPNPLLQPPPSTIGSGPLSVGSAFGMNESGGGMVKIWTEEYNKEMKKRMEEAKGQGVGLGGVRSLSMVRTGVVDAVRSSSARINGSRSGGAADNRAENRKEDSESSRESRSAPDERKSMHTSLDLLIGSTENVSPKRGKDSIKKGGRTKKKRNEQGGKKKIKSGNGSVGGIIKRESRMVRGRSKKRTPTKTLGRTPLGDINKASTSPIRREPSVSLEEIDKAKGNINHILSRKRMPLADVIKSSSGGFVRTNKLRLELEEIMGDYGFSRGVDGIMELAKKCMATDHAGSVDLKSLERSCRAAGKGGKNLNKGVAGGISTKGKAKQVYDGFRFSFEGSTEKENDLATNQFDYPQMEVAAEEGDVRQINNTKFPWLASFDQRMSEAIKQAGDGYMD